MRTISVDWLTLYCQRSILTSNGFYLFEKQDVGSRQFKIIHKVYDTVDNELYAIVQSEPYSPIIPKNACMVQIANRYLYRQDWNSRIMYFLTVCGIKPISISRIDICCDFNKFANNLHPQAFLKGFLKNTYLKNGRAEYTIQGEQKNQHEISYLRFGKHDSEVSVYLYNKSKELREVSSKPYIVEMWKENFLDVTTDVWRLEVSIHTSKSRFVIKDTGEIFRLDLDFPKTQGIVENIYNCVILKYFEFKHNDGTKNKTRMKTVELFKQMRSTLLLVIPTNEACSNKTDKMLLKKLANSYTDFRMTDNEIPDAYFEVINDWIDRKGLRYYFNLKVLPYLDMHKEK